MRVFRTASILLAFVVLPLVTDGSSRLQAAAPNSGQCLTCTDALCNGPGCDCDTASMSTCDPDGLGLILGYKCRANGETD